MDLALHCPCAYPLIKQGSFRQIADTPSQPFALRLSRTTINGDRRIRLQDQEEASSFSSMGRSKKGYVCCKKSSDSETSNPSKLKQEEIISLLKRIQSSISKGEESRGVEEKKRGDESFENKSLTKAILDAVEKSRTKTEGDTRAKEPPKRQVGLSRPQSSFAKRTPTPSSASGPRGKLPVSISGKALQEMTEKEETASLIETMKLAELKEVAKNRGIKGYSKLKKSELLERLRSSLI